ncbi:putative L-ribulokinase [Trypanosoma rangeli]|uniref:Putative L-ribulokinase n=1 Tax=Trypanosoma rangeli TaxID=5698 RepID=A0A422NB41_TRYRA|nr:putative L-ribulokinase [Trypanosoma rangeli]RNF02652.1 putative L-ribulokinase [Trypanosoma rangeli]|eukprot:RNF02652.1 putative L-ribulokinase [Trypanosoma rangeli]
MNSQEQFVIGFDFGSDSARAVLVRASDGKEVAVAVEPYHRWSEGKYCDPPRSQYRQHPLDYIEALEIIVCQVLDQGPPGVRDHVVGMAFTTTGSTPCFVDEKGVPLALQQTFSENPNAMFILWKDHTSVKEARDINELSKKSPVDYTMYSGGIYSSEWFWSKALHVLHHDDLVREKGYALLELCEWLPALVTGISSYAQVARSRCACGHKAMWNEEWGGFPPCEFFTQLHPALAAIRSRMAFNTFTAEKAVGHLSSKWAKRLGLKETVVVAGGAIDCHMGAVGAGIGEYTFVRVMGTSTCDVMVSSREDIHHRRINGICGQVDGSVIPGMIGLEAGQSAYGDVFAWFVSLLSFPLKTVIQNSTLISERAKTQIWKEYERNIFCILNKKAGEMQPGVGNVIAVDWLNGRRTPDANLFLKGTISGLTLGTDAPGIFRALVEATAYGSRAIVERFKEEGVRIDRVIAVGGIAKKSPLVMQVLSDVLNVPIRVCRTGQVCALGAAMFAATAAGLYDSIEAAQKMMSSGFSTEYKPCPKRAVIYNILYESYKRLGCATQKEFVSSL